ncbi:hypothetical protein JW960_26170 [candidate division KSB1 bacterium]|nr:hypothetical protein [candidate division KSB1 bacterium]
MISKHISYREATFSETAFRLGIDNTPNEIQLENMKFIAETIFEPLRILLGDRPIRISSFFRCKKLNQIIGGSPDSQHVCLGYTAAMDLDNDNSKTGPTNKEIFMTIRNNMIFDQLISEFADKDNPSWVHVSIRNDDLGKNRNEIMMSYYQDNCVKYKKICLKI